jgi:solute carrier family 1 (neuronal/epithelial high affinity glutamate transporter), member 1
MSKKIKKSADQKKKLPGWLLPLLLMVGAALGFTVGGIWGSHWVAKDWPAFTGFIQLLGDIFMNLLRMLVVPFVVTSMILGMTSMQKKEKFGRIFGITFTYYMVTTILAVILGIVIVLLVNPGIRSSISHVAFTGQNPEKLMWYEALFKTIRSLFPANITKAAAEGQILGLISFSIIFGLILGKIGEKGKPLVKVIDATNDVLMIFVTGVIWLAPIGIFGLVAHKTGMAGGWSSVISDFKALGWYSFTVLMGLFIHAVIILPAILYFVTKKSPLVHFKHFSEAIITAFSTASSAATLPVTTSNSINNAGYSEESSRFVLPLGATINMDGTALYEAVAVIFIAQAYGFDLSIAQVLIIALTATLAAIGAAAIPHAGLVTMIMVFAAADIPPEVANSGIATILAIDWILDRFRTATNVWGDTIGTAIVEHKIKQKL